MGKLVVIEGTDGSGKETQSKLLVQQLNASGIPARRISFPDYDSPSSGPIKMYLNGDLGLNNGVNKHAASALYAVDRYASFKSDWGLDYDKGIVIVADRYVGSNATYQGAKCQNMDELKVYLSWLQRFEFVMMGIPVPDITLFLDVPPNVCNELSKERANKITNTAVRDILEADRVFQDDVYTTGHIIAREWGWHHIDCMCGQQILPIEKIANKIWDFVYPTLRK